MADYVDDVSDFRVMLHKLRLVAVQPDMTKRPSQFRPAHLVGEDQRALCGKRRPKGEIYDMTPYASPSGTCKRCRAKAVRALTLLADGSP